MNVAANEAQERPAFSTPVRRIEIDGFVVKWSQHALKRWRQRFAYRKNASVVPTGRIAIRGQKLPIGEMFKVRSCGISFVCNRSTKGAVIVTVIPKRGRVWRNQTVLHSF